MTRMRLRRHHREGQSLIEIIVAVAALVVIVAAYALLSASALHGGQQAKDRTGGLSSALEGLEGARSVKEKQFVALPTATKGIGIYGGLYALSGSQTVTGKVTRALAFSSVQRNWTTDAIVASAGVADPYTRLVTVTASWLDRRIATQSVQVVTYLTGWMVPRWFLSLTSDFSGGTFSNTETATRVDGEVVLSRASSMYNASSAFSVNPSGNGDGLSTAWNASANNTLVMTKKSNGGARKIFVYDATNIASKTLTLRGSVNLGNNSPSVVIGSTYSFALDEGDSTEIRVVRNSDAALIASWNLPSNANPTDIKMNAAGTRLYVTTLNSPNSEFYVVDSSNPTSPTINILSQVELGMDGRDVAIYNNTAYIITNSGTAELRIVDLTNPVSASTCDITGTQLATDVEVSGSELFLARALGSSGEFVSYGINTSSPGDCAYLLSHLTRSVDFGVGALALSVDAASDVAAVMVAQNTNELQLIRLSDNAVRAVDMTGSQCDGVTVSPPYIFGACRDNVATLQVLKGGGGGTYQTSGTYTAPAFNTGRASPTLEYLRAITSGSGSVTFKIRTASSQANLATATWVGSDGTAATSYAPNVWAPITTAPAASTAWIQWQATFAGPGTGTPVLEEVLLSYE